MTTETVPRPLTARQREVLRAIVNYALEHGFWPTLRDMMAVLGIRSPNGIMCHVRYLTGKGYLHAPGEYKSRRVMKVLGMSLGIDADTEEGRRLLAALKGEATCESAT